MQSRLVSFIFLILIICSTEFVYSEPSQYPESAEERRRKGFGSVVGKDKEGGWTIFGKSMGKSKKTAQNAQTTNTKNTSTTSKSQTKKSTTTTNTTTAPNPYLWQAAIDSVQLMPIVVSDSSGGVLSTDWYEDVDFPTERYKFNILIKSNEFRADSLHVSAFKQTFIEGRWKDVKVSSKVASEMEDKIFSKAKKLKAWNKK